MSLKKRALCRSKTITAGASGDAETLNYFENGIAYFTRRIHKCISVGMPSLRACLAFSRRVTHFFCSVNNQYPNMRIYSYDGRSWELDDLHLQVCHASSKCMCCESSSLNDECVAGSRYSFSRRRYDGSGNFLHLRCPSSLSSVARSSPSDRILARGCGAAGWILSTSPYRR